MLKTSHLEKSSPDNDQRGVNSLRPITLLHPPVNKGRSENSKFRIERLVYSRSHPGPLPRVLKKDRAQYLGGQGFGCKAFCQFF